SLAALVIARETGSSRASSSPTTADTCLGPRRSINSCACCFSRLDFCAIETTGYHKEKSAPVLLRAPCVKSVLSYLFFTTNATATPTKHPPTSTPITPPPHAPRRPSAQTPDPLQKLQHKPIPQNKNCRHRYQKYKKERQYLVPRKIHRVRPHHPADRPAGPNRRQRRMPIEQHV